MSNLPKALELPLSEYHQGKLVDDSDRTCELTGLPISFEISFRSD